MRTLPTGMLAKLKSKVFTGTTKTPTARLSVGGAVTSFSGGAGTSGSPYQIRTQAELQLVSSYLGKYFILMSDIKISGTFTPIGSIFTGNFNGNFKHIVDLNISNGADYTGLFARLSSGAQITNLVLKNATISGTNYVGSFVGYSEGLLIKCATHNCNIIGSGDYVGAIAGEYRRRDISNPNGGMGNQLYSQGTVTGVNYVGGIFGRVYATPASDTSFVYITSCESRVTINATSKCGGIVGGNYLDSSAGTYSTSYIYKCLTIGNINGTSQYQGGILGYQSANVESKGESLIHRCIVISNAIDGGGTKAGRIMYIDPTYSYLSDNWGLSTCTNNGSTTFPSPHEGPQYKDGLDKTLANLQTQSTYESNQWIFDSSRWFMTISGDYFPTLAWVNTYLNAAESFISADIEISNLRITREQGANSQRMTATIPNIATNDINSIGNYSPESGINPTFANILLPGAAIQAYMGYGSDEVQVFEGAIDDVLVENDSGDCQITLECRDDASLLLDQIVNDGGSPTLYYLNYVNKLISYIVEDLLAKAGITSYTVDQVNLDAIAFKTFDRCTYADAIEWCQTISAFELIVDETGHFYFKEATDRQPEKTDEAIVLSGVLNSNISLYPVVTNSIRVRSAAGGGGTLYSSTTDYEITAGTVSTNWKIKRRVGSTISNGATVYVTYVYAAYVFQQGYDIYSLSYKYSRRDIYAKVIVKGLASDGETVTSGTYSVSTPSTWGITSQKVLFIDEEGLDTDAKCLDAANEIGNDMIKKYRECEFAAIAVPWLQVGDCIQVVETSSGISEIYRILSMELESNAEGNYMYISCLHYGYAPG